MDSDRRHKIPPIGIGGRYLPTDPIEPDRARGRKRHGKVENLANSGRYSMVQESVLRPDTARTERLGVRGSYPIRS
jgi:hypothetical protein